MEKQENITLIIGAGANKEINPTIGLGVDLIKDISDRVTDRKSPHKPYLSNLLDQHLQTDYSTRWHFVSHLDHYICKPMAFNENLNNRIREALQHLKKVEEKYMFGGVCYMVNGKMCIGVVKDEMMCRIDPAVYEESLERKGCSEMIFTGKPMKGYVFVSEEGMRSKKDFDHWIGLCLEFNKKAKAAKKRK